MSDPPQKKRHHYVPVAYLKGFCDASGRIFAYRKDNPTSALHVKPDEIGFENYYYSQPLPNENQDNNSLEDFFSTIEAHWPPLVREFRERKKSTRESLYKLFSFLSLMRVRGPATRDMVEARLAESVKSTTRTMDKQGALSPKPKGYEDILDKIEVSIDPHMSIRAMGDLAKGFGSVLDRLGFCVLCNRTTRSFITSDNPVVYFDPDVSEAAVKPYRASQAGRIELILPISSDLLLIGRTEWKFQFSNLGIQYLETTDRQKIGRINRYVARFGYRIIFSSEVSHEALIRKHAPHSPILETEITESETGELLIFRAAFGERRRKPKWIRPANQVFDEE